ncbi:MAG: hypothetical protein JWM68_578 [Verrucomicrobiales bacterium]|nr:hypothetical protein [Verrucomicrobiales bacterium]
MQDMKEVTNRWLARNAKGKGLVACGVLYSDQTTVNHTASPQFPVEALDNTWNCLANAFQFLRQNQNDGEQMRWVFENFFLHGAIRGDNACLGIFTSKSEEEYDPIVVNRMISEFKGILISEKR